MKRTGYIFTLIALLLISCNGTSGSKDNKTPDQSTVKTSEGDGEKTAAASGKLEHLTAQTFKLKVMDYEKNQQQWVFEGDKPAIVDFYADWCRPCRMIAPILEELAVEYKGKIDIYKVDTEAQRELAAVFGIQSLPTVLFIPMQGKPSMQKGALPKESYKQIIDDLLLKNTTGTNN
ncbi:MAG: thioredoxin [Bacteroidales bacterium]|jgi:thioredoxin|nr:thioredoxin [Bacteroidales bacterium]